MLAESNVSNRLVLNIGQIEIRSFFRFVRDKLIEVFQKWSLKLSESFESYNEKMVITKRTTLHGENEIAC